MCTNYRPTARDELLERMFQVWRDRPETPAEIWATGPAPFIRPSKDGSGDRVVDDGHFGLLPKFADSIAYGRRTYNARSETIDTKPSFRSSWRRGLRCIIPADVIFEPNHEGDAPVRWRIQRADGEPLAIAGIYSFWWDAEGVGVWSFAMATVNATGHPVFQRMHRPADEKRMPIFLDAPDYDRWLGCSPEEASTFFRQWHGPLETMPDPLPPRAKKQAPAAQSLALPFDE